MNRPQPTTSDARIQPIHGPAADRVKAYFRCLGLLEPTHLDHHVRVIIERLDTRRPGLSSQARIDHAVDLAIDTVHHWVTTLLQQTGREKCPMTRGLALWRLRVALAALLALRVRWG